jgi:hypothetical protein
MELLPQRDFGKYTFQVSGNSMCREYSLQASVDSVYHEYSLQASADSVYLTHLPVLRNDTSKRIPVLWDVMTSHWEIGFRRFEGT